ncbi:MAG: hypothetical protein JOY99_03835 [Sphingomonadaceae bacterium]|nr:hypothetical protein [Sphingomonadaceae bacterium]
MPRSTATLFALALLAACHRAPKDAPAGNTADPAAPALKPGLGDFAARAPEGPAPPPFAGDPATFVPLQSQPVKDAIYRAMTSGDAQRWQDGAVSGYAVPSKTTGAYGCRAVTYTVDQLRDAPPATINACH